MIYGSEIESRIFFIWDGEKGNWLMNYIFYEYKSLYKENLREISY